MFENINQNLKRWVTLSDEEVIYFNSFLEVSTIEKKSIFSFQDEVSPKLSYINKGLLKAYRKTVNNQELIIYFPKDDWWIGDITSFYYKKPSLYQYEALETCEIFTISLDSLKLLTAKFPNFECLIHEFITIFSLSIQERYINLLTLSAKERYDILIEKYPDLVQRVSQKLIASYIGVTPEFLSKMRGQK